MLCSIEKIVVVGAGSAGLMAALAFQRAFPDYEIVIVYSSDVPVIGVGESTTVLFPPFLHQSLGISAHHFFRRVRASWKLGVRFLWGDPDVQHFDYPFDQSMASKPPVLPKVPAYYCLVDPHHASRCSILMDRGMSPCLLNRQEGRLTVQDSFGYHLDNMQLIDLLTDVAKDRGIQMVDGRVDHAEQDSSGRIAALRLKDGRSIAGDLFVDCSGFSSQLLNGVMQVPFVDYSEVLLCDSAIVGQWERDDAVKPFTTAETMDYGWCWQIEFVDRVTRGYVYSSSWCSDDEAVDEFRAANPRLGEEIRAVKFRSGRYEQFWAKNVVGLGNASGFAEPLEATALHLVIEQIRLVTRVLSESNGVIQPQLIEIANHRYRQLWDEVRDFLAVHYRFNRRRDSPFWRYCRQHVDLGGASEFVSLFQNVGPSTLCAATLPGGHVFGYDGFMNLLIGQRVPTQFDGKLSEDERRRWQAYRDDLARKVADAIPVRDAHRLITK